MKRNLWLMGGLSVFAGCASAPTTETGAGTGTEERRLSLREGEVLEGPACGLDAPECPEGLMCVALHLDTGRRFQCVRAQDICSRLQCSRGECVILESFPAQIRCAS